MRASEAAKRQEGVERSLNGADRILQKRQPFAELGILAHDRDAPHHVGMAIEIFGGRMDHEIKAVLERTLDPRARKCVVRDGPDAVRARDGPHAREVDELEQRIGRRLDPDEARVGADGALQRGRI